MVLPLLNLEEAIELHLGVAGFEDAFVLLEPFLREFPDDKGDKAIDKHRPNDESENQNSVKPRHILELRVEEDIERDGYGRAYDDDNRI